MKQKLYLECYSGISGDMTVAALLDLGADATVLEKALNSLPISGFQTKISRVSKAGIDACDFDVILKHDNHDHDMAYLHGDKKVHTHHWWNHLPFFHHHVHRHLKDIVEIINQGALSPKAKDMAIKIFDIIAEAESKAHGLPKNKVHFHEVGAIDSIVDIVAVAVCLDNLGIDEVIVPVLWEGSGTVRCQHGVLPIPVPAVANIVKAQGLNLHITTTKGEFVTPTGAAIAAAVKTSDVLPAHFNVVRTGIGAGKRTYERPSLLRAMLIEETEEETPVVAPVATETPVEKPVEETPKKAEASALQHDTIIKLESDIDDCTGEALGFTMDKLLEAGARDVHYFPVFMKKNRPGYQLNVLCKEDKLEEMERIIFEETTTIGIRIQRMERAILLREIRKVQTPVGEARVKVCTLPNGETRFYPEYADVAMLSKQSGKSFQEVYRIVLTANK